MRKLAWFTAGFAGACLVCCYVRGARLPLPLILCALTLLALPLRLVLPRRCPQAERALAAARRVLALLLGGTVAAGWFWGYTALFFSPAGALAGDTHTCEGQVASWPERTSIGGYSLTVSLSGGFNAPDVLVYAGEEWGQLQPGDLVRFTGRFVLADTLRGKETTYYTAKGIFLLCYCDDLPEAAARPNHLPVRFWPVHWAARLKKSLADALPPDVSPLCTALVTGDKSGLDEGLSAALSRAGASHAVVVSGMHVAGLMALMLLLTRRRRRLAVLALPVLLFYALMAGGTPSAMRAVVMQGVLLLSPFARREYDLPSSLSAALLLLLAFNPYAAGSVSLQLSFAAVAGIAVVSLPLSRRWSDGVRGRCRDLPERARKPVTAAALLIVNSVAVSLGAMAFTQPVLTLYFGQASFVFPVTNLLILGPVQLLLPGSLLTGVLGLFLPGAARALGWVFGWLGRYVIWVVRTLGRPWFAAASLDEPVWLIFTLWAWLILLLCLLPRKARVRPWIPAACLCALFAGALVLARWPVSSSLLTVAALDVGQGASTAFLSGGRTCLVDCGGNQSWSAGDTAADWFAALGVARLDTLVVTHFDADHVNGLARLFDRMEVGAVVAPETELGSEGREALLSLAAAEGARVTLVGGVDPLLLPLGDAILTVYPPLGGGTSNEEGLFVLCSAGEFDALITGDGDAFVEKMLIKYYSLPDVELLMAGHHGSAGSTSAELLDAVRPELAVISVGWNSYGHPSEKALSRLTERGVEVYRTDELGTVRVYVSEDGSGGCRMRIG